VAPPPAPLALAALVTASIMALRERDWPALLALLGGALGSAGGALYVLAAQRRALALTGGAGINADLVPVAVLAPLLLIPLLTLLFSVSAARHAAQRAAMLALAFVMLALPLLAAPPWLTLGS
jgi:hypothetical protein